MVNWERDLLPEHLWIAALASRFGIDSFHKPYMDVLDALDEFVVGSDVNLGIISDFARIPEARRGELINRHGPLLVAGVMEPCSTWLSLYSEAPFNWLFCVLREAVPIPVDPLVGVSALRDLVRRLLPGKDQFSGRVRAVPMARMFKHGRVYLPQSATIASLLPKYHSGCTESEQAEVEAFARTLMNQQIGRSDTVAKSGWTQYFWRHNYDLAVCLPARLMLESGDAIGEAHYSQILQLLERNSTTVRCYLKTLAIRIRIDLYEPLPDEVLFGLFSRVTRLYCLIAETPQLWARDTCAILLRCIADNAITFLYLLQHGTTDEFGKFRDYGDGQQKLLALQLQDNHPEQVTLEGLGVEQAAERLGGFPAELLDIELGHWTKKDTRHLAMEAGAEDLYRLVFNPASGDVHGNWVSLRQCNLLTCAEPLHRFHRLPSFAEPPFFINILDVAAAVYERCVNVGVATKAYPQLGSDLERVRSLWQSPPGSHAT